jgi:pimeloyl-ACP methyl ester carboxylesterase
MLLASKERYSPRDVERYAHLCFGDDVPPMMLDAIRRADGHLRPIFARSMMRGDCADQKQVIENAEVPVALVNGEHDPFVRLGYLAGLNIPNLWDGHPIVLRHAGHAAFRDAPEQFTALLLRFAAEVELWKTPVAVTALRA